MGRSRAIGLRGGRLVLGVDGVRDGEKYRKCRIQTVYYFSRINGEVNDMT